MITESPDLRISRINTFSSIFVPFMSVKNLVLSVDYFDSSFQIAATNLAADWLAEKWNSPNLGCPNLSIFALQDSL